MAGISKTSRSKPAPKAAPKSAATEAPDLSGLEAKVASLEAALAQLQAQLADVASRKPEPRANPAPAAAPAAADPRVEKMWKWLRRDRIFRETLS